MLSFLGAILAFCGLFLALLSIFCCCCCLPLLLFVVCFFFVYCFLFVFRFSVVVCCCFSILFDSSLLVVNCYTSELSELIYVCSLRLTTTSYSKNPDPKAEIWTKVGQL